MLRGGRTSARWLAGRLGNELCEPVTKLSLIVQSIQPPRIFLGSDLTVVIMQVHKHGISPVNVSTNLRSKNELDVSRRPQKLLAVGI